MKLKDCLTLTVIGLGLGGLLLANKADYYELRTRHLELEIIKLRAEYEGFKESAVMLND